jgi:hypothetical protein
MAACLVTLQCMQEPLNTATSSLGTLSKSRLSSRTIMTPINLTIFCTRAPPSPEPPYVGCRITFRGLSVLSVSLPRNEPGHLRFGCPRSLYVPPGGTPYRTQAPVWPWVQPGRSVYDMSQQPSVDPSSRSGYIQPYSVQSTNEQYPLGFRPQGSPGPMPGAWPPSQGPADVQDAPESRGSHL